MFGRSKTEPEPSSPVSGKGHATPTRKEAEAARKKSLTIPKDPKAARAAARERARGDRLNARAGLASGDPSRLPARDAGPERGFVRDYVDSRFTIAEFFVPVAFLVLVGSLASRSKSLQSITSLVWLVMLALIVVDSIWLAFRVRKALAKEFPDASTKGMSNYAIMRGLQIRRLRLPKPRFRAGGKPVVAKQKAKR